MRKIFTWGLVVGFLVANVMVYQHAKAMTDFIAEGERTASPEDLSFFDKLYILATGITLVRRPLEEKPSDFDLNYTDHHFENGLGFDLHAWHIPKNESDTTVLMFHGYGGNASQSLKHAKEFHQLGFNSFVVDFFGSGGSSGSHTTIGVSEAIDVEVAVNYVRERWPDQKIWLFGQSMGAAAITRAMAVRGVAAEAVILESSYDTLLHTAQVRFNNMGLPGSPFAQWLLFWGGVRHGFNPFTMNPVEYASAISAPTLVLQGGADPRVPIAQAEAIDGALAGWHKLAVFENSGHVGMLESDPQRWRMEVKALHAEAQH